MARPVIRILYRISPIFVFCLGIGINLSAQELRKEFKAAQRNYHRENYLQASVNFEAAWGTYSNDKEWLYKAGISHWEVNRLTEAIKCFERLNQLDPDYKELQWYLARCYHQNHQFYEALKTYKKALKSLTRTEARAQWIRNELMRCYSGHQLIRKDPAAILEPLGVGINSFQDEFAVCPSIQFDGKYYFSARRNERSLVSGENQSQGQADIYVSEQNEGLWQQPRRLHTEISSPQDEQVLDFCQNGSVMIFLRGWKEGPYKIFTDTFGNGTEHINYHPFEGPLMPSIGDQALTIFQDSILIFASSRTGGYGAYDLYISFLRNGNWTEPANLGPDVNSIYNENYPFLAKDGRTLYFSSDRLESMGGYDLFRTVFKAEATKWTVPENVGWPISSAGNDTHFKLTQDGLAAVLTSDRKSFSLGKRDVYLAYFTESLREQEQSPEGSPLGMVLEKVAEQNAVESSVEPPKIAQPLPINRIQLEPLYHRNERFLEEPPNKKIISTLLECLQRDTAAQLEIIGHSYQDSKDPLNLYYSIKLAEQLKHYLSEHSIDSRRIHCVGAGASFPVARNALYGNRAEAGIRLNQRIELRIKNENPKLTYVSITMPVVNEALKPDTLLSYVNKDIPYYYTLELGKSASVLNHPMIDFSKGIVVVERDDDASTYRYYFGRYTRFDDAQQALRKGELQGISFSGIHARLGDEWLTRDAIIDHVVDFPDLIKYLDYLKRENR